ncbi:cell wall hydrolase [Photobacterium kishitanii]|uniref:N-acetylmuramoyl-L-alanine amidase n=1 Tax=Photobacterium kishitanii TaxID=318456 RepID=A0AAX0YV40_9GAMM|nr:N-acetylmuramoyl-L-alanine amidase [Photobacterium kishitanii]KJG56860.1 cell wall hydrolase [Photobacterium kishitanii]KJG60402.1 cell wall hydrolase [Photobacterium kishitanii]KJG64682.1 cell wall hydrolase [Photobacterium kishitanii]KJG68895.1 cell wall hydrolase [Photobacterium kishitanii]PSX18848.1 N-acetylmuramoyl-L-alanine amidase [Photobacterium kishitanii]
MKPLILLDPGHGGIINNIYQTPGKRSPIWSNGSQLFEGEFNRAITQGISQILTLHGIENKIIVPEREDISLQTRVNRANHLAFQYPNHRCVLISVHANAGGGSGFEIYTSRGQTHSDIIADHLTRAFRHEFPNKPLRSDYSDGDSDKECDFYILRKTKMAAVLTENFFMDNEIECCLILMQPQGRQKIIDYHVQGILAWVQGGK